LAVDFANRGQETITFLGRLDDLVRDAGGAVYPAKDARMSAADFQRFYPIWHAFAAHVDPHFSSSFWRRVTAA
jgi:L-gulonolactone oxidase